MSTKYNTYTVTTDENLKTISNGKMTIHYIEPDTLCREPRFLAHDVAREMGYTCVSAIYQKEHRFVDTGKGNLKRTMTRDEVEDTLSRMGLRMQAKSAPFREFWENDVLPEFDAAYYKLKQERKLRQEAEEELKKLREALKQISVLAS